MPNIRKVVTFIEDGLEEAGRPIENLYRKVAVAAVISNPYAGRYSDNLDEILDFSVGLGDLMSERLVDAMGDKVLGYGKASLVGTNGEVEHGHAFLTTSMADRFREAVGGGKAWLPSTGKRGAAGTLLDIPLAHKDALKVRSFYDTITISVPDSPEPGEVVIALAGTNAQRPNFRLGGLMLEDVIGEDGLV
jgi:hypothetical protein